MRLIALAALVVVGFPFWGCAQENYKVLHAVESYENGSTYRVVNLGNRKFETGIHPKNVILMIGDGMGVAQIYAGLTANRGALNITQMPYVGFSITYSANRFVTDSGAGGTALATGQKTNNGSVGVDVNGVSIPSILEIADKNGLHTGLVSTSAITHATPASFIAHVASRSSYEDIAKYFTGIGIDVFMGGGRKHFENRIDGRNLISELISKGVQVVYTMDEASKITSTPLAVLTADEHNERYPARGELLPNATQKSIELLNANPNGFFLMVEGSQIDWGCHQNDVSYEVNEMLDFDRAVGKALEFAEKDGNTLVIITADHETGGLCLIDGNISSGSVSGAFVSQDHTGVMVPVFAYGPGAELFSGVMQNTDVFKKMREAYGF